jgi:hypothetical protein
MAVDLPLAKPVGPPAGQPFTWPEGVLLEEDGIPYSVEFQNFNLLVKDGAPTETLHRIINARQQRQAARASTTVPALGARPLTVPGTPVLVKVEPGQPGEAVSPPSHAYCVSTPGTAVTQDDSSEDILQLHQSPLAAAELRLHASPPIDYVYAMYRVYPWSFDEDVPKELRESPDLESSLPFVTYPHSAQYRTAVLGRFLFEDAITALNPAPVGEESNISKWWKSVPRKAFRITYLPGAVPKIELTVLGMSEGWNHETSVFRGISVFPGVLDDDGTSFAPRTLQVLVGKDRTVELPMKKTLLGIMQKHVCSSKRHLCKLSKGQACTGVHVAAMLGILPPRKCFGCPRGARRERSRSRGSADINGDDGP